MRVVLTRPEADAQRTMESLRARGHEVLSAPLMRIEPLAADLGAGPFTAILITSANGARAAAAHPQRGELVAHPLFAVGARSAEAARAAGFQDVTSAEGDAEDLTKLLVQRFAGSNASFLYLAGEERSVDLAGELAAQGLRTQTVIVYRAVALPFPDDLVEALRANAVDAVLHFSKRSAALYLEGATAAGVFAQAVAPRHLALSGHVGQPLAAAGAKTVIVAGRPNESALLAALETAQG